MTFYSSFHAVLGINRENWIVWLLDIFRITNGAGKLTHWPAEAFERRNTQKAEQWSLIVKFYIIEARCFTYCGRRTEKDRKKPSVAFDISTYEHYMQNLGSLRRSGEGLHLRTFGP